MANLLAKVVNVVLDRFGYHYFPVQGVVMKVVSTTFAGWDDDMKRLSRFHWD